MRYLREESRCVWTDWRCGRLNKVCNKQT